MASYIQGYDEDRFVTKINRNFFCLICFNVLRDPVLCPKNQHCFCRSCITKYLETTERCPTCSDHLTVETLVDATRIVKDYLNESNIRCVYIERGCQQILQLEQLDEHEATCGFSPVVCTNEGCSAIVSRRDLVHHETEACEFRKLKCHSCEEMAKCVIEIETRMTNMKPNMKKNIEKVEKNIKENVDKIEENMNQKMDNIEVMMEKTRAELQAGMASLKTKIDQQIERNTAELEAGMANLKTDLECRLEAEVRGFKAALVECFDEMKDVLVKMDSDRKREIIKEGKLRPSGGRENIVVAGGFRKNSVEMLNWHEKVWSPLQPLPEKRYGATSFVYNNHVTIAGGYCGDCVDTMIQMIVEASPDLSTQWSEYPVKLPAKLAYHSSVVYNGRLIVVGGSSGYGATSDCVYEIPLSHHYASKILFKMPEPRHEHSSAMFDDNLLIVGGSTSGRDEDSFNSVLLYDLTKNDYKHLGPLPYEVNSFATVKYGDNIVVIGGRDEYSEELNTVLMYNVSTQQSHMLPPMKCKRWGSAAVVIGNNIVVLGGYGERGALKSVEGFSFDTNTWSDLPEMSEERWLHTASVV